MKKVINERFADHVQSIAFHLTLSRSMIETLGLLYHFGHVNDVENKFIHDKPERWEPSRYVDSHTVPIMNALERRGLVIHRPYKSKAFEERKPGDFWRHQSFLLTDAGEKVCELLVIAGLLVAKETKRGRSAA